MAALGHDVTRMRATAARDARLLEREHTQWSMPLSLLVRGALAYSTGEMASAVTHLTRAVEAFDRADMRLYAAAARRRLAAIASGDRAERLRRESDAYMSAEDIRNPASMTRLLAPALGEDA
jgi:hypothetical protein